MKRRPYLWKALVFAFTLIAASSGTARSLLAQMTQCVVQVGPELPDLIVDLNELLADIVVTNEKFARSSCAVVEGCVSSPGPHQLLRFTTSTANIGTADLLVGAPMNCPGLFHLSECHGHYHFEDYADYRLWTEEGYATWLQYRDLTKPANTGANAALLDAADKNRDLISGRKQGFCMRDDYRFLPAGAPGVGETPKYLSCMDNQGISVGWSDRYDYRLEGQYVEIDGLKAGIYVLENHANPDHLIPESSYTNNSVIVQIRFAPGNGRRSPVVEVLGSEAF